MCTLNAQSWALFWRFWIFWEVGPSCRKSVIRLWRLNLLLVLACFSFCLPQWEQPGPCVLLALLLQGVPHHDGPKREPASTSSVLLFGGFNLWFSWREALSNGPVTLIWAPSTLSEVWWHQVTKHRLSAAWKKGTLPLRFLVLHFQLSGGWEISYCCWGPTLCDIYCYTSLNQTTVRRKTLWWW